MVLRIKPIYTTILLWIIAGSFSLTYEIPQGSRSEEDEFSANFKVKIAETTVQKILDGIHTETIEENLRYLSEKPHLAGTERDEHLASYIKEKFLEFGFDSAELVSYYLLLSTPDEKRPNKIYLHKGNETIFESRHKETPVAPDKDDPDFVDAYLAYTPAGSIKTPSGTGVVYVNYGREEDFQELVTLGVNVSGHVVMARYGKIFRGNKIENAAQYGAVGAILFSDPEEVAREGTDPENVYDKTFWIPGSGMQRGSTNLGKGDPLTPGLPAKENVYRIPIEEATLPKIPAQPIGYADAKEILKRLGGEAAPEEWQGGIEGLVYRLGPEFSSEFEDVSLSLITHNSLNVRKNYNVIGTIRGEIEPDRYVLVGNHRDAWGYGASDPSSGTAQLLESAKLFGSFLKEGKRPQRTLVFCSWGAEEMGLLGSSEWVEEFMDKLQSRAVAYINTDTCGSGPKLIITGSPFLWDVIINMTKLIPGVEDETTSLYEEWKTFQESSEEEEGEVPSPGLLKGGSDHVPFSFYAGITSIDIRFRLDKPKYGVSMHPGYHTFYDNFRMLTKFLDPSFKSIQACSRLSSLLMESLSESLVLPFSLERLPKMMLEHLNQSNYRDALFAIYDKYGELENSVIRFGEAVQHFKLQNANKKLSPLEIRIINDQMMALEQSFLLPNGLESMPSMRNALIGLNKLDTYGGSMFPGLSEMMTDHSFMEGEEKREKEEDIKKHISHLTVMVQRAADLLKEVYLL